MVFIQRKCLPEFYSISLFWEVLKYFPKTFLVAVKGNAKQDNDKGKEKKGDEEDKPLKADVGKDKGERIVGYLFSIIETCKSSSSEQGGQDGWTDLSFAPTGNVYSLAVLPSFRGKGIGKKLLEESIRRLLEEGPCTSLWLNVRISNLPAIRLYEKLGFTR